MIPPDAPPLPPEQLPSTPDDGQPPPPPPPDDGTPTTPPSPPDVPPPADQGQPWAPPPPAQEPEFDPTVNESPVLPHSAVSGAARASATFAMVIDLATNPDDADAALAQILALVQAMLADVSRFVPAAMQQTAADQVQAVADQLGQ